MNTKFTCGYCETILPNRAICEHPCFAGVTKLSLREDNRLYRFGGGPPTITKINDDSLGDGRESPPEKKFNLSEKAEPSPSTIAGSAELNIEEDDTLMGALIHEVGLRPALYDSKLPHKDRTAEKKAKLWREVYLALEGRIREEDLPMKFKSLRDRYVKEINDTMPRSFLKLKRKKWIHIDSLTYLNNCIRYKRSILRKKGSPVTLNASSCDEESISLLPSSSNEEPLILRTPSSNDEMVIPALGSPENSQLPAVSPKRSNQLDISSSETKLKKERVTELDSEDHFSALVANLLRERGRDERLDLQIKILQLFKK